ncbi:serine hydrolase domain-containing protein [Kitasatospora sp. NPDC056651]|uniref:serine hydrolase domain-containing protein n=1 Tax=Kitasatospora sp. NPDC056651 TaxID=3345892 RepID=UPI00368FC511
MTADPTIRTAPNAARPAAATGRRRPALRLAVTAAVGAGLLAALAPAAAALPAAPPAAAVGAPARQADWQAADAALAGMTGPGYSTSALGAVREDGRLVWSNATGVADLATGAPADPRGAFRIGSATKTFVSTTLLQLVGERRLGLDDRLESLLPGIVPNSAGITVRQLLNHTSGVADYTQDPAFGFSDQWLTGGRYKSYRLRDLVDIADKYPPAFAPGQDWQYSNTNYILIGMIIEKLTGHSWNDEVTRRIIRPLRLTNTWMPGDLPSIPGPHAHAYVKTATGPVDVTVLNPSMAGSAGGGISTTTDLTAFLDALLGGRLLRPAELAAMKETTTHGEGQTYGLGLQRLDTPCGPFWGHAGGIPGYSTMMLASPDGKREFAANTTFYDTPDQDTPDQATASAAWRKVTETALCGVRAGSTEPALAHTAP